MNSSQYASDSISTKMPTWLAIVVSLCVALLFAGGLASVNAVGGWMLDDLFSLWASDRNCHSLSHLAMRILPDFNPPLYFSLLYFVRQIISDDGVAIVVLNIGAIVAAAVAVYFPSRRLGLSGLAIAGIAAFALSGPVLYFASEGRAYVSALSIVFVTSWYTSLAITGFPGQLTLKRAAMLGSLAAMTHVYAALFCGSLAAGLSALTVFSGRKELLKPGLALGLAATIVFGIWLSVAFDSVENLNWIEFTVRRVLDAALSVKELALGANWQVIGRYSSFCIRSSRRSDPFSIYRILHRFSAFCVAPRDRVLRAADHSEPVLGDRGGRFAGVGGLCSKTLASGGFAATERQKGCGRRCRSLLSCHVQRARLRQSPPLRVSKAGLAWC